ncbi:MAG: pseudouridine synthase, partial [Desulfatiglandales bacterium]
MQWDGIGTASKIHFEGPPDTRLDSFLAEDLKGELSRSRVQSLIRDGFVKVNGRTVTKPSHRLRVGDLIELEIPPPRGIALSPQEVPFGILYEDSSLAVIQKPAGIVVHPAPGNYEGTLVHGLLGRLKDLSTIGGVLRPGIVHRLDKGTSGVMLVAKNDKAHLALSSALKMGQIRKGYIAIAYSREEIYRGKIELPIGRDRVHRKKMQIDPEHGRFAFTEYFVLDKRDGIYLLYVKIKTGRTH